VGRYIARRLLIAIPTLLAITFVVYVILALAPLDPLSQFGADPRVPPEAREAIRKSLGLDQPWSLQYGQFLGHLLQGDLGISYRSKLPVAQEVFSRLPATAELAFAALVFAVTLGLSMGIISAVKRNTIVDRIAIVIAMLGSAMPTFWSGLLLIVLFAVNLGWLPASGRGTPYHLIMPSIALGAGAS